MRVIKVVCDPDFVQNRGGNPHMCAKGWHVTQFWYRTQSKCKRVVCDPSLLPNGKETYFEMCLP